MARKSNKTEQVLKLLTTEEDSEDCLLEEEPSKKQEPVKKSNDIIPEKKKAPETEVKLKTEAKPEIRRDETGNSGVQAEASASDPQEMNNRFTDESCGRLVNLAELLTTEMVNEVMVRLRVCTCPLCVNDVLALALNSLPTKYVTTDEGKQYFQLDIYKKQYETDIMAALTKACVRVKASPRH
jgi:competence protein ComFB